MGEIRDWIGTNSIKKIVTGKRIVKATHVLKFTHSSSNSDAFLLEKKSLDNVLSTASIKKELDIDIAHNNGALISVSRFLALKLNNKMIFDLIIDEEFSFLDAFKKNSKDLELWKTGFKNLIEKRTIKTLDKVKQIYFPVENCAKNSIYHLLSPLFASSLQEEIKKSIVDRRFLDENKKIENQKNKENPLYYYKNSVSFPNIAVQIFGGEHPKNVSMLNANRSGKAYLFSSLPPTWESSLKAPIFNESVFETMPYNIYIKDNIDYLIEFLIRFETVDLSIKDPKRLKHLNRWVTNIIEEVIAHFGAIQNLEKNWSKLDGIKLKKEHQALLDPYRDDKEFQGYFLSNVWQECVCQDFAQWLNNKLKAENKKFTPQIEHTKMWKDLMKDKLREDVEDLIFDVKRSLKENR